MKMRIVRNSSVALLFSMLALQGFAQSAEPADASSPADAAPRQHVRAQRGIPCWKQAGMTADMVNQRWHIEDQQKVSIAQVCSEPSTSAQQKHDKIEQIHADTDRSLAHLIPAKELAAFNKCQADLDQRNPKPASQKQLGPCGGVIPDSTSTDVAAAPEHRHNATPANH
jgi:hypothetical protein